MAFHVITSVVTASLRDCLHYSQMFIVDKTAVTQEK